MSRELYNLTVQASVDSGLCTKNLKKKNIKKKERKKKEKKSGRLTFLFHFFLRRPLWFASGFFRLGPKGERALCICVHTFLMKPT